MSNYAHKTDRELQELIDLLQNERLTIARATGAAMSEHPDAEGIDKRHKALHTQLIAQRTQIAFHLRNYTEKFKNND